MRVSKRAQSSVEHLGWEKVARKVPKKAQQWGHKMVEMTAGL